MKISEYLSLDLINYDLKSKNKQEVINELATLLSSKYPELNHDTIITILNEREKLGSTGIGYGIAIPHGKLKINSDKLYISLGISKKGIDFNAIDGKPVYIFFVLLAPEQATKKHLMALAKISRILKKSTLKEKIINATSKEDIYKMIKEEDEKI